MYRGRGAGRWAESSPGARGLPYKAPACARTAARREEPEGITSLPCWPCCAAAAAAMRTRVGEALKAHPPLGQRNPPPPAAWAAACVWGGGGGRSMSATNLVHKNVMQ